jgi:tetratricopeptide (TPR) repeat protein
MLDTVKAVARRWLAADPAGDRVHHRHATAFTDAALEVDRALRSPDELAGRRRLDEIVAEVRQAHGWSRDQAPELADRLSAALHLTSYGRLWGEPATWSRSLLEVAGDPVTAPFPGAHLLVAGAAANRSELGAARVHADCVLTTTSEPRLAGIAHEILSDVAMYSGRLDDCEQHAEQLLSIGHELGDEHMRVVGLVNQSLLRTFGGSPDAGLRHLDGAETDDMPPSSLAWLAYARGEALADLGERDGAVAAFEEAIEIAGSVGNPFVVSVGQSSLATEHARHGDRADAYAVYADCFRGYLRHGNLVHSVITLRNLVGLLHADGDLRGAVVIGVATNNDGVRPTHGTESAAITETMEEIESAVWPDRFAAWVAEARALDLDGAVRRALAIVETHRADR